MANGSRHNIFAVAEPTYAATPANPALDIIRITGTTLGLAKDGLKSEEVYGDRQIRNYRLGANNVTGDINFELSYGSFDQFIEAVLGGTWQADTPVAGTDQVTAGTERRSFTFIRFFEDLAAGKRYFVYKGCEITSMSLSIKANAMITGTFTVVGSEQEILTDLSKYGVPTYPAESTTQAVDAFTGTLQEDGNPIAVITEITLTLNNGIEPRFVVGSKNTIQPSIGDSDLTGQITAYFEDSALVEKFVNETESNVTFTMPDLDGNEQKVTIPRFVYTGGQPDTSGTGPITLSMPFQALRHAALGTNIVIDRTAV